ncbi:AraC family transcriptional regulator [Mesorhizobium sp.]|uniref:AraC family transcriptional regulator n=1 Tax=Mesorhizobium sp. TaxID=1871066 RepID=UPI000FE5A8D4|nr:AraC family transcriptional regulator [Mesorhizobium sp.]RWI66757.1 MAG: AraC family transcriptional regulator [Mesorhizobium sp.]TIN16603.1 MAG: AraC family transcriptional regulator [Mesorhizobium sp.]
MTTAVLKLPTIPMRVCKPVLAHMRDHGVAIPARDARTGFDLSKFQVDGKRVFLCECIALMEFAAREISEPAFGLNLGRTYSIYDLEIIGYMMLNSKDVGDALRTFVRYFKLRADGCRFDLIRGTEGTAELTYTVIAPGVAECRQDVELALAWGMQIIRTLSSRTWRPISVQFTHTPLAAIEDYREVFQSPVHFEQGSSSILFDSRVLEHPVANADPQLLGILRDQAESLISRDTYSADLASLVGAQIDQALLLGRAPRIDWIAKQLGMTTRTLQRRLDEQGLMLRDLVDAKRKAVSTDLLEKSDYGLADIAMILGYSEVSAFVRAFTRWTGMPPKAYRVHWREQAVANA